MLQSSIDGRVPDCQHDVNRGCSTVADVPDGLDQATLARSAPDSVLVAGVAAAIPAYRAATIEPVAALLSE